MLVKATAKGFFGSLRLDGDEFEVPVGTKGSWFAPVATEVAAKAPAKALKGKTTEAKADADADTDEAPGLI